MGTFNAALINWIFPAPFYSSLSLGGFVLCYKKGNMLFHMRALLLKKEKYLNAIKKGELRFQRVLFTELANIKRHLANDSCRANKAFFPHYLRKTSTFSLNNICRFTLLSNGKCSN